MTAPLGVKLSAWASRRLFARLSLAAALVAAATAANAANNSVSGVKKDEFQTAAPLAILIDADSGTVLFEKNADQPTAPSSLAKLMTVELVFNEIAKAGSSSTTNSLISEDAWRRGGAPSHTSSMFAPIHSRVKVARPAARRRSSSRPTTPASRWRRASAGNETAFAIQMNERARELGLTQSNFTNSTGLPDPRHAGVGARSRQARAPHHPHLSAILRLLRREGIHLEQDPPAEPQSAAGDEHRRRRA